MLMEGGMVEVFALQAHCTRTAPAQQKRPRKGGRETKTPPSSLSQAPPRAQEYKQAARPCACCRRAAAGGLRVHRRGKRSFR